MANLDGVALFTAFLRRLEETDPKHPDTWNPNYQALINNDVFLKAFADEVHQARNGNASLAERLQRLDRTHASLSPGFIDEVVAALKYALDQVGLANSAIRALKQHLQQEGEVNMANRGLVRGCTVSRSTSAARNLNLAGGICFANGRTYAVAGGENQASVPANIGAGSATVTAYLHPVAGGWQLAVGAIGEALPGDAIPLYSLTLPAHSTDTTDPNLAQVTLTSLRRLEPGFPRFLDSPASRFVPIARLTDSAYRIDLDLVSARGAPCPPQALCITSRASNGFVITLASAADAVHLRYRVSRLDQ